MPAQLPPDFPIDPLRDLVRWWRAFHCEGLIIGGVAASLIGRPRATRDADAVVLIADQRWEDFLTVGARYGFVPREPDALAFARESRVLLLHHQPSGVDVDISMGALPFEEEAVARGKATNIGGVTIPLPTPEDLIIMKAVAHRGKDLIDIEGILDANPKVDKRRIRRWVREFAKLLDMPEILDDLERLLTRRRRSRGRKPSGRQRRE